MAFVTSSNDVIEGLAALPVSMGFNFVLVVSLTLIALSRADTVGEALTYSKDNVKDIDADLLKLAAIPSISSLPEHARDIVAASEWLIEKLKAAGLEVNMSIILDACHCCYITTSNEHSA